MIDSVTYCLSDVNFFKEETIKKQIIIGHTSSNHSNEMTKWRARLNGKYKKTAAFTIDLRGQIYQHFDPIYFSEITGDLEQDKKNILILLENEGWLVKDNQKNEFINWSGYIYNRPEPIHERKWRNNQYWAPYTGDQFDSTISLVNKLCDEFFIKKNVISHNTKIDNSDGFEGILYRSNIEYHYTDLSPAWNCENFKYKLEQQ